MDRNRLLGSRAFRHSLVAALFFALAAALAIVAISRASEQLFIEQAGDTVDAEIRGLAEQYRLGGLPQLERVLAERSLTPADSLYLLVDGRGRRLAGNFSVTSPQLLASEGRVQFAYSRNGPAGAEAREALASVMSLPEAHRLVVGRDIQPRAEFRRMTAAVTGWGMLAMALIGGLGGLALAARARARIEGISATSRRIMAGDLSQRIQVSAQDDEFDRLAASLNAMLARIEELMAGLREVSDNVAHDLKTPLARLRGRLDSALHAGLPAALPGAIEEAIDEADDLIRTFDSLLAIARLEAGSRAASSARFDLAPVIAGVADLYEPLAEQHGVALKWQAETGLEINGERQLLAQAIANLVDNAIKYAGGSNVSLAAARTGEEVRITVADRGPGIAPADRERALRRFVRLETSRSAPGTGLGLSLVAAAVRLHGGSIALSDAAPGLIVTLRLPAAAA